MITNDYSTNTQERRNKNQAVSYDQKTMDKFYNMSYNEVKDNNLFNSKKITSVEQSSNPFADWKTFNKPILSLAGDGAIQSVEKGLAESQKFINEAYEGANSAKIMDASVKWSLANDAHNQELSNRARDEMIGHMSKENKGIYLKDTLPLTTYINAKDDYDYKAGTYSTDKYLKAEPDEKVINIQSLLNDLGYTDKYGNPLKVDGKLGARTLQAYSNLKNNTNSIESTKTTKSANNKNNEFNLDNFISDTINNIKDNIEDNITNIYNKIKNLPIEIINKLPTKYGTVYAAYENGVPIDKIFEANKYGSESTSRAYQYALNHNPQYIMDDNKKELVTWHNTADAFRHFTWNYQMANNLGYSTALKISSANEISYLRKNDLVWPSTNGTKNERDAFMPLGMLMDTWNNLKGVNQWYNTKDGDYEKAFEYLLKRNDIVTNLDDAYKKWGFTDGDKETIIVGGEALEGIYVTFDYSNGYITNIRKRDS